MWRSYWEIDTNQDSMRKSDQIDDRNKVLVKMSLIHLETFNFYFIKFYRANTAWIYLLAVGRGDSVYLVWNADHAVGGFLVRNSGLFVRIFLDDGDHVGPADDSVRRRLRTPPSSHLRLRLLSRNYFLPRCHDQYATEYDSAGQRRSHLPT